MAKRRRTQANDNKLELKSDLTSKRIRQQTSVCMDNPISGFVKRAYSKISEMSENLSDDGIVVLRSAPHSALRQLSEELSAEITRTLGKSKGSYTVGCWDLSNADRNGGVVREEKWRPLALKVAESVQEQVIPALRSFGINCELIRDMDGTNHRTIYIRAKPRGASTPMHEDMEFYKHNMPSDRLTDVYRYYTVWWLLSNPMSEVAIRFADGAGNHHDGPVQDGDIVIFHSTVQHWSETRSTPKHRLSIDFRIKLLDGHPSSPIESGA